MIINEISKKQKMNSNNSTKIELNVSEILKHVGQKGVILETIECPNCKICGQEKNGCG